MAGFDLIYDGQILSGRTATIDGVTYRLAKLRQWPDEALAAKGVTKQAIPDPVPDLDALKADALRSAHETGDSITAQVTDAYSKAETLSWDVQEAEATIVNQGGALPADALLPGLAEDDGQALADYAAEVLAKAASFRAIARQAVRLRRKAKADIEAVTTLAELEMAVTGLKTDADATAAALGIA